MAGHIHAELIMQYAIDAKTNENPWEYWQYYSPCTNRWHDCREDNTPCWYKDIEYRRKPKTININGIEVPEPVRDELVSGTQYFTPCLHKDNGAKLYYRHNWNFDHSDKFWLSLGLIHLAPEAAEIHAKALLSFTECKE